MRRPLRNRGEGVIREEGVANDRPAGAQVRNEVRQSEETKAKKRDGEEMIKKKRGRKKKEQ